MDNKDNETLYNESEEILSENEVETPGIDTDEANNDTAEGNGVGHIIAFSVIEVLLIAIIALIMIFLNKNRNTPSENELHIVGSSESNSEKDSLSSEEQSSEVTSGAEQTTVSETETATEKPTYTLESVTINPENTVIYGFLKNDSHGDIINLINNYYEYMMKGEVDKIDDLLTANMGDTLRANIELAGEIVEEYRDIECYMLKGLEANTYVVYVAYDIKFVNIDTLAPALSRFYVITDDGEVKIFHGEIPNQINTYLQAVSQYNQVKELTKLVNDRLNEAKRVNSRLTYVLTLMK